ncbi:MAG: hypothetical protein LBR34_00325 [Prevotella sp.]|jgi:hypothetical protein|nr:hypothetical protein [Prevotella sp.]
MKKVAHVLGHIVFALAAAAVFGAVVMWLWNALVPEIFGLASINFWQALALLILCRLLFGSFGRKGWGMGMKRHHHPFREKWLSMTPEERKEFVKNHRFKHHFGHSCFDTQEAENQN